MLGWFNAPNIAIQTAIMGAVHLTHPACADRREDFVRAQALTGVNCQWLPLIAEVGKLYNLYLSFERCGVSRDSRRSHSLGKSIDS
jgi:hypothetical protein